MNSSIKSGVRSEALAIILASLLMAVIFGLVSVTANPILVGLAVSLIAGVVLLVRPAWIVWLVVILGLLVTGVVPLYTSHEMGSKMSWGVSFLGLVLMALAFFTVLTSPNTRKDTPAFMWIAIGFMCYSVFVSLVQWDSSRELIGGFKRYFHMWGLLFALSWLAFDDNFLHRLRKFILVVALVQLPFALYELIALVPIREGLKYSVPGLVPIDVVAGTFGASIYGGGFSGEMAAFLIIMLAFLLAYRMERILPARRLLLLAALVSTPLFLGETKAVVILLPLMFLTLYRREIILRPHYGVASLVLGTVLTAAAGYVYLSFSDRSIETQINDILAYNVYNKGYGFNYLNRTSVLTFWAEQQGAHDPVSFLFGNGLGSSLGGANIPGSGHIAMRYPYHGIGLTGASTLLWDMGVLGSVLFAAILISAWRTAGKLYRRSPEPFVRADAAAIQTAIVIFAVYLFFRRSLLDAMSFQIVFAVMLGYLVRLHRTYARSPAEKQP